MCFLASRRQGMDVMEVGKKWLCWVEPLDVTAGLETSVQMRILQYSIIHPTAKPGVLDEVSRSYKWLADFRISGQTPKSIPPKINPPKVHSPKIHSPKIHSPKIHSPKIHYPKIHYTKIHSPKIHSPTIHSQKMPLPQKPLPKNPLPQSTLTQTPLPKNQFRNATQSNGLFVIDSEMQQIAIVFLSSTKKMTQIAMVSLLLLGVILLSVSESSTYMTRIYLYLNLIYIFYI